MRSRSWRFPVLLLAGLLFLPSYAWAQAFRCDDAWGRVFNLVPDPQRPWLTVLYPANFPGPPRLFGPVPDPIIALISLDSFGNGLMIARDGGLLAKNGPSVVAVGFCPGMAMNNFGAPPILPHPGDGLADDQGPQPSRPQAPDQPGDVIRYMNGNGQTGTIKVSDAGSMEMNVSEEQARNCAEQ